MPDVCTLKLTGAELSEIKEQAASKLGVCKKQNDIIGQQIFSILSLYARVIYYPLGEKSVWGFTRIIGTSEKKPAGKPFVAINSSIPVDCQVFAAAHELYHIWFDEKAEIVPADIIEESASDRNELKANRFAAEFLVDKDLLLKELNTYSISGESITTKDLLRLSELFTVPYRTMAKRLYEAGVYDKKKRDLFLSKTEVEVLAARKRFAIPVPQSDSRIAIDTLNDLAVNAYEKQLISYEKLAYLLSISELKPADIGICEPKMSLFPSDDELSEIMEG